MTPTPDDQSDWIDYTLPANRPNAPVGKTFADRFVGIVLNDSTRENGYVFLMDVDGTQIEYFAHRAGFQPVGLFQTIVAGQAVTFRASRTPKGFRAFDIQEAVGGAVMKAEAVADLIADHVAQRRAGAVRGSEIREMRESVEGERDGNR